MSADLPREIKPEDVRVGDTIRVEARRGPGRLSTTWELIVASVDDDGLPPFVRTQYGELLNLGMADGCTITLLDRPERKTPAEVLNDQLQVIARSIAGYGIHEIPLKYLSVAAAAVIAHYEAIRLPGKGNAQAVRDWLDPYGLGLSDTDYQSIADAAVRP